MPNQIDRSEKKIQIEKRRLAKKSQKIQTFRTKRQIINIDKKSETKIKIRKLNKKL